MVAKCVPGAHDGSTLLIFSLAEEMTLPRYQPKSNCVLHLQLIMNLSLLKEKQKS